MTSSIPILAAFGWFLGTALGGGSLIVLMMRSGYSCYQIALVLGTLLAAVFAGSKALYLAEVVATRGHLEIHDVVSPHMRIPGGIVAAILAGPFIARVIRVPFLEYADTAIPAAGLLFVGVRIGCFLQGCCFGTATTLPWGMEFPPGTDAFNWQVRASMIPAHAPQTLSIHPLQVYFALAGIIIFVALVWLQQKRPPAGTVLISFAVLYFWSTWGLENLRQLEHGFTRTLALLCAIGASFLLLARFRLYHRTAHGGRVRLP